MTDLEQRAKAKREVRVAKFPDMERLAYAANNISVQFVEPYRTCLSNLVEAVEGYAEVNKTPLSWNLQSRLAAAKKLLDGEKG